MSVNPTTQSTGSPSTGQTTSVSNPNGVLGKDDFLKLLVAQMQNQDPMNPMDDNQTMSQMAQFSTVEGITNLNTAVDNQNFSAQVSQSVELLGKTVTWLNADGSSGSGVADKVTVSGNAIQIDVNGQNVSPGSIVSVQ
jgi:flagellar basal-body rod modification protein FlgD